MTIQSQASSMHEVAGSLRARGVGDWGSSEEMMSFGRVFERLVAAAADGVDRSAMLTTLLGIRASDGITAIGRADDVF